MIKPNGSLSQINDGHINSLSKLFPDKFVFVVVCERKSNGLTDMAFTCESQEDLNCGNNFMARFISDSRPWYKKLAENIGVWRGRALVPR